ncbi:RbsD/FucU domain-containing protein [Rhizobium laguerreae]|uniref:RbsD/FucU domain-containing protein n=1 Tax=Rhizobium laguerreae TaxID=1076926 RepID=UPI0039181EB7
MLKGIDTAISAELMGVMMLMGHDDELAICDINPTAQMPVTRPTECLLAGHLQTSIALKGYQPPTALFGTAIQLDFLVKTPALHLQSIDMKVRHFIPSPRPCRASSLKPAISGRPAQIASSA